MYLLHNAGDYDVAVLTGEIEINAANDNVDVEVRFRTGSRYAATFFTVSNLNYLFEKTSAPASADEDFICMRQT